MSPGRGFLVQRTHGAYTQSPIYFASSSDAGATFTAPKSISGNVPYVQGSRPVVGPDGSLYVLWDGATWISSLDSTYVVKSTDGGASRDTPVAISTLRDIPPLADTAFPREQLPRRRRGALYATWTTQTSAGSVAVWSKSSDGAATWSTPQRIFTAATRTPVGYPVAQPSGGTLNAPSPAGPVEDVYPSVSVGTDGHVVFAAYRGDVVSPWQTCAAGPLRRRAGSTRARSAVSCPARGPCLTARHTIHASKSFGPTDPGSLTGFAIATVRSGASAQARWSCRPISHMSSCAAC